MLPFLWLILVATVVMGSPGPSTIVAIGAVFADSPLGPLGPLAKTVVLALMIAIIHLGWLLAGAAFARVFYNARSARIANVGFAATLVATAALAAVQALRG